MCPAMKTANRIHDLVEKADALYALADRVGNTSEAAKAMREADKLAAQADALFASKAPPPSSIAV